MLIFINQSRPLVSWEVRSLTAEGGKEQRERKEDTEMANHKPALFLSSILMLSLLLAVSMAEIRILGCKYLNMGSTLIFILAMD
ncbi:hypothetical protein NC651_012754 [Populus alba x Populus x berolinensis]|nr:hypothetical protein NC651_012754 [Populus alba x Populus x berolinensis]